MRAAVVGFGAVGQRVVRQMGASGVVDEVVVRTRSDPDLTPVRGARVLARDEPLGDVDVVVLTTPGPQASTARLLLGEGHHVVATGDARDDVHELLALDSVARGAERTLVVGAACSPGLSGLLAREGASSLSKVDELHVQVHGTGGPACARQHHFALQGQGITWRNGEWISRPAGTGRELCWFPDPVGAHDCYVAESADPLLLHRGFSGIGRITARLSATRRDRLTARLPMLRPPHPEGLVGGLRVEVRGAGPSGREVVVLGIAQPVAVVAGAVAAELAEWTVGGRLPVGVVTTADEGLDVASLLGGLAGRGVHAQRFVGAAQITFP